MSEFHQLSRLLEDPDATTTLDYRHGHSRTVNTRKWAENARWQELFPVVHDVRDALDRPGREFVFFVRRPE